eukprot:10161001-Alexandrium_andersonii.AAC.1
MSKIEQRGKLASTGLVSEASEVDKEIRKMAKRDRSKWFSDKLTVNVWGSVRIQGKGRGSKVVRLRGQTPEDRPAQ